MELEEELCWSTALSAGPTGSMVLSSDGSGVAAGGEPREPLDL